MSSAHLHIFIGHLYYFSYKISDYVQILFLFFSLVFWWFHKSSQIFWNECFVVYVRCNHFMSVCVLSFHFLWNAFSWPKVLKFYIVKFVNLLCMVASLFLVNEIHIFQLFLWIVTSLPQNLPCHIRPKAKFLISMGSILWLFSSIGDCLSLNDPNTVLIFWFYERLLIYFSSLFSFSGEGSCFWSFALPCTF